MYTYVYSYKTVILIICSTMQQIFTLDANIGAGKSTVLEYLHTHYRLPVDVEPIAKWQPYLDDMYKHNRGAFEFQVRVWLDRCWIQKRNHTSPLLMERSPYFQANVFVPANVSNGRLTVREYYQLMEMYQKSSTLWSPQGYIYLRSRPEKCKERIMRRNRNSEDNITLEYLHMIHDLHEQAYMTAVVHGLKVIVVDVEGKTVPQIAHEIYNAICILGS